MYVCWSVRLTLPFNPARPPPASSDCNSRQQGASAQSRCTLQSTQEATVPAAHTQRARTSPGAAGLPGERAGNTSRKTPPAHPRHPLHPLPDAQTRYTAELHYTSAARRSRNDARLEVVGGDGVQEMSQTNLALFLQFQHMLADGRCPPLLVVYDPVQGFIVQADAAIRDRTLLAEFVGEVMDMHELQTDEGARGSDSLMHLLHTARPQHDLVICPDRTGNIARFFSGINNSVASSRQGLNVRAARFAVNGEARVVLYAARHIVRGERLVFDYNGLYKDGYPTDHFVG